MRKSSLRLNLLFGGAFGSVLLFTSQVTAARLLQVYIEQDGEVVAHTFYEDNGRANAATVWRYLGRPPIMVDDDVTAIDGNQSTMEANLTGDLLIRFCQHKDGVIAQARRSTLTLCRTNDQSQKWFLPDSEVERTAIAAGLGRPNTLSGGVVVPHRAVAIFLVATLILLGAAVATLLFRRSGQSARG